MTAGSSTVSQRISSPGKAAKCAPRNGFGSKVTMQAMSKTRSQGLASKPAALTESSTAGLPETTARSTHRCRT